MMPLRSIHVGFVSSPFFSASDSYMATSSDITDGSFSCLDVDEAQKSSAFGLTTSATPQQTRLVAPSWPSAEQSYNVVDAVMDYLDTLSSGCTSEDMAAVHHLELEAVVDGVDVEG
jgi:hypothetical protein